MTPDDIRPWPLRGYAPGGYLCRCKDCSKEFEGDKRADQCLECAVIQTKRTNLELFDGCAMRDRQIIAKEQSLEKLQSRIAKATAFLVGGE